MVDLLGGGCLVIPRGYQDQAYRRLRWAGEATKGECVLVPFRFLLAPQAIQVELRAHFENALRIDLLRAENVVRLENGPAELRREVLAQPRERWIVLDEVQRVPRLLDEVHLLMEEGYKRFVLSGSSAPKLRRGGANLLARRAVLRELLTLTSAEIGFSRPPAQLLRFSSLPLSVTAPSDEAREDFLRAYVTTHLAEEVRAEGLVRDLGGFSRFLEVAALAAAQMTNTFTIARDAGVSRETARGYFEILVDTLIGAWLPAFRPRARIKEVALPKFYWFDSGVLRAAAGGAGSAAPR